MSSLVSGLHNAVNALLPFTRPGTPLLQDVVHTIAICAILYYLPQIAEWQQQRRKQGSYQAHGEQQPQYDDEPVGPDGSQAVEHDAPLEGERLVGNGQDAHPGDNDNEIPRLDAQGPDPAAAQADVHPLQPGLEQQPQQQQQPRRPRDQAAVGTKKAKSLARREQRRAYHEFVRGQAEQQRAMEASTAEAREAALAAERDRRADAERRLDAQRDAARREARADREQRERRERERRVWCEEELAARVAADAAVDLVEVAEELWLSEILMMKLSDEETDRVLQEKVVWVERLARAVPGLLGRKVVDGEVVSLTLLTASRWIVRLDRDIMAAAYERAEALAQDRVKAGGNGELAMEEFGHALEFALMATAEG